MKHIDNFLNKITMYKLVLYGLTTVSFLSIIFGFLGVSSFGGLSLLGSLSVLLFVCYVSNIVFSKIFDVQTNVESVWISAFILFLILYPITSYSDLLTYSLVGAFTMGSKYLLAINKKHVFNPVAISIFLAGALGSGLAIWHVGSSYLIIPVAVLGFLVLRKVKRFQMFFAFVVAGVVSSVAVALYKDQSLYELFKYIFLSGPILFLGSIMLTEPLTTPPGKKLQIIYAGIVGLIFGADFHFGPIYNTPELALVIGNIFSFIVSPKDKLVLKLVSKDTMNKAGDVDEFRFEANKKLSFKAGQYLEWTLGHDKPDSRGNRRYFTISSSPTEKEIKLGVKYYDNSSSFKIKLGQLKLGEKIYAGSLAGEFTLPDDKNKKMVWIAGGIGVTPFRGMAKYMTDVSEKRNVVLFFSNKTPNDVVYKDIFDEAEKTSGLKTLYVVNTGEENLPSNYRVGMVSGEMIKKEVPDYKERIFYISGPHGMVTAFEKTLKELGVPRSNIKIDFFPGFV